MPFPFQSHKSLFTLQCRQSPITLQSHQSLTPISCTSKHPNIQAGTAECAERFNSPQSVRLVVVILDSDQNVRNGNVWQDAEVLGYLPYPPPAPHLPPVSQKVGLVFRNIFKFRFFRPFSRVQKFVKILSMKKITGSRF